MCEVTEETETATKWNPEKHRGSNWQKDGTKMKSPVNEYCAKTRLYLVIDEKLLAN